MSFGLEDPGRGESPIVVAGWVQEHLFEEFLAAVCDAIAAPLDDQTRRYVRDMVDRSESDARTYGGCLESVWVVITLAGRHTGRCEFAFESVASWVLLRVELPPEVCPPVEAAMLRAQRARAEPGAAIDSEGTTAFPGA